jgi:hypothetical protein
MSEKIPYQNSNYNPHVEMQKEINKKIDKIDINKKVKVKFQKYFEDEQIN